VCEGFIELYSHVIDKNMVMPLIRDNPLHVKLNRSTIHLLLTLEIITADN
jgi:hypothetical protein